MYGVIGSAVVLGALTIAWIKKTKAKDFTGEEIVIQPKEKGIKNYLFGGIIFGLGWALAGVCPAPMFALLGHGFVSLLVVIIGAILGTFVFGLVKKHLPF